MIVLPMFQHEKRNEKKKNRLFSLLAAFTNGVVLTITLFTVVVGFLSKKLKLGLYACRPLNLKRHNVFQVII
jgi:hypothetical protein